MGYFASSVDTSMERTIANAAAAGRMYSVTSNNVAVTSGNAYAAISLFWAARATKIIVISAKAENANATNVHQINRTTTDPSLSGHAISGIAIRTSLQGGASSSATLTSSTEGVANSTGTLHRSGYMPTGSAFGVAELLPKPSDYIVIPPNVAGGVLLLMNGVSGNGVLGDLIWLEV